MDKTISYNGVLFNKSLPLPLLGLVFFDEFAQGVLAVEPVVGQAAADNSQKVAGPEEILGYFCVGKPFGQVVGEVVTVVVEHMVLPAGVLLRQLIDDLCQSVVHDRDLS